MKKILITGSNGFIGKNLKEQLLDDYNVIAISRTELDLLDSMAVWDFLRREKFDTVIHCATHNASRNSAKDTDLVLDNNLRMFFNLARGSKFYGKMIYFGSGAEYGREFMPPRVVEDYFNFHVPTDGYGFSKYICNLTAEESLNIYNLTLFGCFGKYEDWEIRFISNAICKTLNNLDITIRQNVFFDYLDINDLLKITRFFIEAKNLKYHKYNICTGHSVNLMTLAKIILKISGKNLSIKVAQSGLGREYSGNNERLLKELKRFEFTSVEQSIENLYQWYQKQSDDINRELLLIDK